MHGQKAKIMRINSSLLLSAALVLCACPGCSHKAPPQSASLPHSVTLRWEVAPGISIVGYNVYRSTTSGAAFVKVASQVPGPPYEDRLVNSGQTYFYVVTSIDKAGHESRFSAEVRAAIP
jgi:fibronectin type 3 domain-containing protein